MLSRNLVLSSCLMVTLGVVLGGCRSGLEKRPTFPDAAVTAAANADPLANAEAITPLPRIAEERPAPRSKLPSIDQAETAVADSPENPELNLTLAFAYYQAKAYNDAARAFERSANLAPRNPIPLLYLGYTQMAVGALRPAIKSFQKVVEMEGVSRDTISEAYLHIGYASGAQHQNEQAIKAFSQSLGHNPKQGLASLALAGWAAQNKRYDQARDFLNDAINDLPPGRHLAQAHAALGRLAEERNDRKTARAQYEKARQIDEENSWAGEGLMRLASSEKPAASRSK